MFNGLVREIAVVQGFAGNVLSLKARHKPSLGDSIAVNGACLSVVKVFAGGFAVELSKETRTRIASQNLKDRVHIEPAMRLSERVDGHLMQGHIDGVGEISHIAQNENGTDFFVKIPPNLQKFMAPKGSVGVDGVSLTINEVLDDGIRLTIIPLTMRESLFGSYRVGRKVNIESDLLARYVVNALENGVLLEVASSFSKGVNLEENSGFSKGKNSSAVQNAAFKNSQQNGDLRAFADGENLQNSQKNSQGKPSWQDIERISYLY